MFDCRACVQRCLRAIAADSTALQRAHRRPPVFSLGGSSRRFRSRYSSASEVAELPARKSQSLLVRAVSGGRDGAPLVGSQTSKIQDTAPRREGFVLRAELKYLSDPLALADRIRVLLNAGDYTRAVSLVRTASKDMQCTVGW